MIEYRGTINSFVLFKAVRFIANSKWALMLSITATTQKALKSNPESFWKTAGGWTIWSPIPPPPETLISPMMVQLTQLTQLTVKSWGLDMRVNLAANSEGGGQGIAELTL